jgi:hypothetical protein
MLFAAFETLADGNSNFDGVANLDTRPGNVTATANGRIIMSQHQFYQPQYTVVEYKDQTLVPFPNKEMSAADSTAPIKLDSVLGRLLHPHPCYRFDVRTQVRSPVR